MRFTLSLIVLLSFLSDGYSQILMFKPDSTLKKINDTLFIIREFQGEEKGYHAIYIEKNRKSKPYKWLMDFSFGKGDKESFKGGIEYIKEKNGKKKFRKHKLFELPTKWLPVYYYHKNYYLYMPSDWGNAGKRMLSDSLFINWYMDGPNPMEIESVQKENASTYTINYFQIGAEKELWKVIIHIIDPKIKLAVWEYKSNDGSTSSYELYIPVGAAPNLNMIVNHSNYQKQMEFGFEEPDYQKLLKFK